MRCVIYTHGCGKLRLKEGFAYKDFSCFLAKSWGYTVQDDLSSSCLPMACPQGTWEIFTSPLRFPSYHTLQCRCKTVRVWSKTRCSGAWYVFRRDKCPCAVQVFRRSAFCDLAAWQRNSAIKTISCCGSHVCRTREVLCISTRTIRDKSLVVKQHDDNDKETKLVRPTKFVVPLPGKKGSLSSSKSSSIFWLLRSYKALVGIFIDHCRNIR